MNRVKTLVAIVLSTAVLVPIAAHPVFATPASSRGTQSLGTLEQQLKDAQAKLNQLNDQVERAQGDLEGLNRKLDADKQHQAALKTQLANLARLEYQQPIFSVSTVLGARTLDQLLADFAQARLVSRKQQDLLAQAARLRQQDQRARDDIARRLAEIKSAREQAAQVEQKALSMRDAALQAQARSVAGMAQAIISPAPPSGAWPNHFAFGYCTWYVANRRYVPWFGDGGQWFPNARPYGYAEGQTPRAGAIMVTSEGGVGHVAYVERVNSDGSWLVSEMNFVAWDVVSQRTLRPGFGYLIGFIY
jgi:surface antigen